MQRTNILPVPQRRALYGLGTLHYATNDQLCRLLYAPTSLTFVRDATHQLEKGRYITRDWKVGKSPGYKDAIFRLTEAGRKFLIAEGRPVLAGVRHANEHGSEWQAHILAIGDIIILAHLFERLDPARIVLQTVMHDVELKRNPISVPVAGGRMVNYVPDAWMEFTLDGRPKPLCLELDRGTETREEAVWQPKLERLLGFMGKPVRERFGVDRLTIAIPVVPDDPRRAQRRVDTLIHWTEKYLAKVQKERWGANFLFAPLNAETCPPLTYFTAREWRSPFDETLHPLIEGYA